MLTPNEKQSEVLKGPDAMRIIGLTGGIASGKGEVARVFADRGVPVLNADAIGHEAIAPGGPGYQAVVQAFGEGILRDGIVDRSALGNVVFGDDASLEKLNRIVHPLIRDEIERRCERLARQGHKFCLIDAALIAEDGACALRFSTSSSSSTLRPRPGCGAWWRSGGSARSTPPTASRRRRTPSLSCASRTTSSRMTATSRSSGRKPRSLPRRSRETPPKLRMR